MKYMTNKEVRAMSMGERLLFWIAIVVMLLASFGMKNQIYQLEKVAAGQTASQTGGNGK